MRWCRLAKAGRETILLLQDATAELAERVCRQAFAIGETIKLIVALPKRGERQSLSRRGVGRGPPEPGLEGVDFGIESWIIEQAGGLPGILLAASRFGRELRPGAATFSEQIGRDGDRHRRI
jgi:hypothetical protein